MELEVEIKVFQSFNIYYAFNHKKEHILESSFRHIFSMIKVFFLFINYFHKSKKHKSLNDVRQKNKSFSTSILDTNYLSEGRKTIYS